MAISKRTRFEVLRRDNHACRYCGATAPEAILTVDHVTPVALGGSDDPDNLVAACQDCNYGKASTSPDSTLVADVAQDALRWAKAIEKASELIEVDRTERNQFQAEFNDLWEDLIVGFNNVPAYRPSSWAEDIDMLRSRGLSKASIMEAFWITEGARTVQSRNKWRYFCGICWRRIGELNELAKSLIETETD